MGENFQKVKNLILKSNLPPLDQEDLITMFSLTTNEELGAVVELFSSDPAWIKKISENAKAKQAVAATGNQEHWQKIVDEEESELSRING